MRSEFDELNEAITLLIQKDKSLPERQQLLDDMISINNENTTTGKKIAAYERLIKYLSHLPQWDEELISFLGNRFANLKLKK
jgi:hypothetical protein